MYSYCPMWYSQHGGCYITYPDMNMWLRISTTVVRLISLWIQVSLQNVMRSLILCCINIPCSKDINNFVNVTTPGKGTYARVRPCRHTYGNYGIWFQTWTRVIVNRCIGEIIARDLSIVARRLYRMAVTRPQSRVAVTLSPSLRADPLGSINRTREKESEGKKVLYIHPAYILVRNHKSRYRLVQLNGDLSADPAHGETPPPLAGGKNPCRRHLYWAEIQRREEENRETRKHPKWSRPPLSQLPNPCSNDHHSRSLYLCIGLCWNGHGGRASARDMASMGASAASIGRSRQSYRSIALRVVTSH
jgi:hypothetical protein